MPGRLGKQARALFSLGGSWGRLVKEELGRWVGPEMRKRGCAGRDGAEPSRGGKAAEGRLHPEWRLSQEKGGDKVSELAPPM